jgi:hypothetical protein
LAKKERRKKQIHKRRRLGLMRKKMGLSVLVIALAMLLSFGATFDQAQADSVLFPWIVKSTAISTLVSVVNTASTDPSVAPFVGSPQLHWSYYYKDDGAGGVDNSQTASCQDLNFKMTTSAMDIVTVDASGNMGSVDPGLPMWGDLNNVLAPGVLASLTAPGDRRAFLLVDNNTPYLAVQGWNADGTLYGEAMVVEIATGAAWGYVAYNSGGPFGDDGNWNPFIPPFPDGQNGFVSFSNSLDAHGEVIGEFWTFVNIPPWTTVFPPVSRELAPVTLMPPADIITRFFLTPTDMISAAAIIGNVPSQFANLGQRNGNINTRIGVCATPERCGGPLLPACTFACGSISGICLTGACLTPGITLNDESPLSSTKLKDIVCTSADDISAMLDAGTYVSWNSNGGQAWTYMNTEMGALTPAAQYQYSANMIVGKLEWIDGGTTIDGVPVGGTFNNFIHVRNNKDNFLFGPNSVPFGINNLVLMP